MDFRAGLTFRYPNKAKPYADALRAAGIEPVLFPPNEPNSLEGVRGLLVSGGTDINPARYGAEPHPENEEPDDERDAMEIALILQALSEDLPVFAICRGMQLLNVALGGTLIQHLSDSSIHRALKVDPALGVHPVVVEPGTRLGAILGVGQHQVNSRHHQAVGQLGEGLKVTARSTPDGVIEAVERDDRRFVIAVQWHPEDQVRLDSSQRKLFEAFGEALKFKNA